jgi:hypothetical protein
MKCLCVKEGSAKFISNSVLKTNLVGRINFTAKISNNSLVKANNEVLLGSKVSFVSDSKISSKIVGELNSSVTLTGDGRVIQKPVANYAAKANFVSNSTFRATQDKFAGSFKNFSAFDKIYPVQDLAYSNFQGSSGGNLFTFIDEGLFTGEYHTNNGLSQNLYDSSTFIKSSGNNAEYSCNLSSPLLSFKESFALFRARAYESSQKIYDIQLKSPNGDLLCQYKDINFIGDNFFSTYSAEPSINNGEGYTWEPNYSGNFNLSFKVSGTPLQDYDSFNPGFDYGFENVSKNFDPRIDISTIEICSSGFAGIRKEDFLPVFTQVRAIGERLEKFINPVRLLSNNYNSTVWPDSLSIWSDNSSGYSNQTEEGEYVLASYLSQGYDSRNITLNSSTILDSGKLNLVFSHEDPGFLFGYKGGEFSIAFSNPEYSVAKFVKDKIVDEWFTVDEINLKVRAKKAVGSRDYTLDVVGWSDDKLLNVTNKIGGFLQNTTGTGIIPVESGFNNSDYEAFAGDSLSNQDEYFETVLGSGGDHYELYQNVVTSTTFQDYTIPLLIKNKDTFGQSSFFEKLFLDIYPIPSGASISSAKLCVTYKPSNAFVLNILGGNLSRIEKDRGEGKIFPSKRQFGDDIVNAGSGYGPLSTIQNIPHGYKTPDSIKSNYSRRWRGVEGLVSGPFDPNQFDFGFENPQLDSPFQAHYDFNDYDGRYLFSRPLRNMPPHTGVAPSTITGISKNVGFRFKDPTLSSTINTYESIDYNGKIVDSYDNLYDLSQDIHFNSLTCSDEFSLYLRFSPKGNPSGISILVTDQTSLDLEYNYNNGNLYLYLDSENYLIRSGIADKIFPLSLIVTYDNRDLKFYSKYENESSITKSSDVHNVDAALSQFRLLSSSGTYVHEIAFSNKANLLDGDTQTPNLLYKEQSAQKFLTSQSVNWSQPGEVWSNDTYTLPSYVDEDTSDWDLGAFKFSEFAIHEFDSMTKRVGRDAINFRLVCDGVPYFAKTNQPFPTSIDSGVSYHTQIENDFLRFNLSNAADNFYSANTRISKDLPRDYNFAERAFVVETVVDYTQSGVIQWNDGKIGPKLIVSLYTKNQEPLDYPTENYGLINRKIHYLNPLMSWERLDSTFDSESFFDESEAWAIFPEERRLTEFNHKYFSKDIDDMFLQYDLVTPSGSKFDVNLNIHSAHIRLENALVEPVNIFDSMNIYTSGEFIEYGSINLFTDCVGKLEENMFLYISGVPTPHSLESVNLYCSGAYLTTSSMNMHILNKESISNNLALWTSGNYRVEAGINLLAFNNDTAIPNSLFLPLQTYATDQNTQGIFNYFNLAAYSSIDVKNRGALEESLRLRLFSSPPLTSIYSDSFAFLHTFGPFNFSESMNLVLFGKDNQRLATESKVNLSTICYPDVLLNGSGNPSIVWTSSNVGKDTEELDDYLLEIPSTDVIRGVESICYGDCSLPSGKCIEEEITTHDTQWNSKECFDGGIARGSRPYYNSGVYAFDNSGIGPYNGHFYTSRKYDGLYANSPYSILVTAKKGTSESLDVPRKWEEWEYGTLGDIAYSGSKITNNEIVTGDKYGKTVKVKDDIMGVGAPYHQIDQYEKAGAIFLYRRQTPLDSGDKAGWDLETKLTLPTGFIGDYFYDRGGKISFPGIGTIPEKQWEIGQEGRELGHSFDIAVTDKKEIIVAGGPGAKWTTRSFDEIVTSDVNVAILVFNDDEFEYTQIQINKVLEKLETNNFLYKYFADPPVQVNIKIIACIPTGIFDTEVFVDSFAAQYLTTQKIPRVIPGRPIDVNLNNEIVSGIKEGFFRAFPFDSTKPNNNIPAMLGFYVDNSRSLGRQVVTPALDQFVNFYKNYSFQSGLRDFYDNPATGYAYEYVMTEQNKGQTWFDATNNLIDEILDTGKLVESNNHILITSGIGLQYADVNAIDFNLNPDSGGRVYIFEKEFGDWSLIQQIKSPDSSNNKVSTRFGHSVSISDDSKVISIGSPYLNEGCMIYEFSDNEKNRLYDNIGAWLNFRNNSQLTIGQYFDEVIRYQALAEVSGVREAGKQMYSEFDTTNRFKARSDFDYWGNYDIKEYSKVYTHTISDLQRGLKGLFTSIPMSGAPNPRLGFSTAVNEDGSIVAFGSPTDSLGPYDNADFYFKHEEYVDSNNSGLSLPKDGTWASNVNAGAVRIFEKNKRNVPIVSKVMEYNKFGNLSNTLNNTEGYDQLGIPTNTTAISKNTIYDKTKFADFKIPADVGSIFIITPEIDAANDEVIEEIKNWMSLGDRRLVLVGDDPVWEKDGAYAESNRIINKILEKLDSRMRLHPARNEKEALLVNNPPTNGLQTNIIKCPTPQVSLETNVDTNNHLHGFGVADIRLHIPDVVFTSNNWTQGSIVKDNKKYGKCSFFNPLCGPPIAHEGDLRASWIEREFKFPPDPSAKDPYTYWTRNIPFEFNNNSLPEVKPKIALDIVKDININARLEQPTPLMVAAEFGENISNIPAVLEKKELFPIYKQVFIEENTTLVKHLFSDDHLEEVAFIWSANSGNLNFVDRNIRNNTSDGIFYDPLPINNRDALLQADATLDIQVKTSELTTFVTVDSGVNIVAKQELFNSSVYLIASLDSESISSLSFGNDENISFYDNLVRTSCSEYSRIIQLGGWTGNTSFVNAYQHSGLSSVFKYNGHLLTENWSGLVIPASTDVLWIANTSGQPSEEETNSILNWLRLKNKKLVITYDETQQKALNVLNLCEKLGLSIKPWYLPGANTMASTSPHSIGFVSVSIYPPLKLNNRIDAILGCSPNNTVTTFKHADRFIPIKIESGEQVVYYDGIVLDKKVVIDEEYNNIWRMNTGIAQVQFPAIPGSGYRIFYNWVSDYPSERFDLTGYIGDVHYKRRQDTEAQNPETAQANPPIKLFDYDENGDGVLVETPTFFVNMSAPSVKQTPYSSFVDIQVPANKNYINFFITGNQSVRATNNNIPKTCKFLSVSGCPLPINRKETVVTTYTVDLVEDGYEEVIVVPYSPPRTVVLPATIRPIMTDNTKYCIEGNSCGGRLVADGPVVIAEEPEHFSDFPTGFNRSRILLISDSTIVNGRFNDEGISDGNIVSGIPTLTNDAMLSRVNQFLNSLTTANIRQEVKVPTYSQTKKIVSPEKGSPAIYALATGSGELASRFKNIYSTGVLSSFADDLNYDETKIIPHIYEEEKFEDAEKRVMIQFGNSIITYGVNSKFEHIIDGTTYKDSSFGENPFSELLKVTGKDFLDYDLISSGYPGDLFGYSLDIHNDKLVVGSPYSAWKGDVSINLSGIVDLAELRNKVEISSQGGGGSAYVFEKDIQKGWTSTKKLKTETIKSLVNSDRFGWAVSMDGDFAAISAPGHDFGNIIEEVSGQFVRKEFDAQFDIGDRNVIDSGSYQEEIGAIFTFENRMVDLPNRRKEWLFAEKVNSPDTSNNFGNSVSISRFARTDSDYAMAVGSSGSSYITDAMLRHQPPINPGNEYWIKGSVFGQSREFNEVEIALDYSQNDTVYASGTIYSDNKGQIFLEVSGQDPREFGFIKQRPYIHRVDGVLERGIPQETYMNLFTKVDIRSENNQSILFVKGPDSDTVYNTLDLSTYSAYSIDIPSGINLFTYAVAPTLVDSSGMSLYTSGIGILSSTQLDLRIRGK